jgi:hypothetical protein
MFAKMMQSGQAIFNLLQIELQQKSPTILSKSHKWLQQKSLY